MRLGSLAVVWVLLAPSEAPGRDAPSPTESTRIETFDGVTSGSTPPGWRTLSGTWSVQEGELACDGRDRADARVMLPRGPWADFRLQVTFRLLEDASPPSSVSVIFSDGGSEW